MNSISKNNIHNIIEGMVKLGAVFLLALTIVLMYIAIADKSHLDEEANTGSFAVEDFNDGWILITDDTKTILQLPTVIDISPGDSVRIVNTLPDDINNGASLMIRSSMEDLHIYVDGILREEYSSASITNMSFYIPSAFVVCDLDHNDSGKEIAIDICFKTNGVINEVSIGNGNNVWFPVLKYALPINLVALLVLVLGITLFITVLCLRNTISISAPLYLGLLMIDVALWVFSESAIRQFIFRRPSLSQYFAYLTVELISILACMYFDAVQHRVYHRRYIIAEAAGLTLIIINIILNYAGAFPLYRTMIAAHIWTGVCALVSIASIISDIKSKRITEYRITGIGMICFVAISLCELLGFYINRFHMFGIYICIALIVLMISTVIQTIYDEITSRNKREYNRSQMTIKTIETIAGAIDARDEYTGGHSERVGYYASRLAREMAADYDLTEEDILRVHYIGLVHDIGKIGIADSVLNKVTGLTDEEFGLMKMHTEIGYEIMSSMGDNIEGLLDGIRYHHERFDGKGYPDGLSDTDIPLIARILALADSYDVMTSNRVYRKRLTDEDVRSEFIKGAGAQFDPALTEIFVRLLDKGQLRANTVDGLAVNKDGIVPTSSILEGRLQNDLQANEIKIVHASHIRMMCYLIKLMERKGKGYQILFAHPADETCNENEWEEIRKGIKPFIEDHDIYIQYSTLSNIIALFDRSSEDVILFEDRIQNECPQIRISHLISV